MSKRVVILGAGFGGLELATRLSETIADEVRRDADRPQRLVLLRLLQARGDARPPDGRGDQAPLPRLRQGRGRVPPGDGHGYRSGGAAGGHRRRLLRRRLLRGGARGRLRLRRHAGLAQGGHEYYTLAGAERLRDALAGFKGGKVLVSVLGQPFKCPPAPFEGSFLLDEHFTQQGIRDSVQMATTFPMRRPVPVTGEVSQMFRDGLAARGVEELPEHLVTGIDPATRTAQLASGGTLPYDLFVGIPIHRAPDRARRHGPGREQLGARRPVQPQDPVPRRVRPRRRLQRPADGPQGGDLRRVRRARGRRRHRRAAIAGAEPPAPYEGSGVCYAEFGGGLVSKVEVNFLRGDAPEARRNDPSLEFAAEKERVRRDPAGTLVRALLTRPLSAGSGAPRACPGPAGDGAAGRRTHPPAAAARGR